MAKCNQLTHLSFKGLIAFACCFFLAEIWIYWKPSCQCHLQNISFN